MTSPQHDHDDDIIVEDIGTDYEMISAYIKLYSYRSSLSFTNLQASNLYMNTRKHTHLASSPPP